MVTIKKTETTEAKLKDVVVEAGIIYVDGVKTDINEFIVSTFEGTAITIAVATKSVEELN